MKAKLHKMESGYILSLNGDIDDPYAIVNKELAEDYEWHKLSLKNCQAIERGYDLEELACNEIRIDISFVKDIDAKRKENSSPCIPLNEGGCVGSNLYNQVKGFEKGFQKALEILSDKKFSEEDILDAWEDGATNNHPLTKSKKENLLKSLQQTEWEVEVEMEYDESCCKDNYQDPELDICDDGCAMAAPIPKLDSDGCLILKGI